MPQKKSYYVQVPGWVLGEHRKAGDKVEASEAEAKFLLLNGTLGEKEPPTKAEQRAAQQAANSPVEGVVASKSAEVTAKKN